MQLPGSQISYNLQNKNFNIRQEVNKESEPVAPPPVCTTLDDDEINPQPPPKKKLKGLAAVLMHVLSIPSSQELTIEEKVNREMRRYEEFPAISMEVEPLVWWKNEARNYPLLVEKVLAQVWHQKGFLARLA